MHGSIHIDDAGTPGQESPSRFLHENRKSWAAVVIPDEVGSAVDTALKMFVNGVHGEYGAEELHFTEIYSGKGAFKNAPPEERIDIFDLMVKLFDNFQLPVIYQTMSHEFAEDHKEGLKELNELLEWWDMNKSSHYGLLLLCWRVSQFRREFETELPDPFPAVVDEGLVKHGVEIALPAWGIRFLTKN